MIDTKTPIISKPTEKQDFSTKIHNFLNSLRTKTISEKQKLLLSTFISDLKKGTESQKRRFLMYYNLSPNSNNFLGYTDIAKIEHCSSSAIRTSVGAIILQLIKLEDNQKLLFLSIINQFDI